MVDTGRKAQKTPDKGKPTAPELLSRRGEDYYTGKAYNKTSIQAVFVSCTVHVHGLYALPKARSANHTSAAQSFSLATVVPPSTYHEQLH